MGQCFYFSSGFGELNSCSLDMNFNSSNVNAGCNWVVWNCFKYDAVTLRRFITATKQFSNYRDELAIEKIGADQMQALQQLNENINR